MPSATLHEPAADSRLVVSGNQSIQRVEEQLQSLEENPSRELLLPPDNNLIADELAQSIIAAKTNRVPAKPK